MLQLVREPEKRTADGCGTSRVHKYAPGDTLLFSWAFTIQGRTVIYQAQPPAAFDACVSAEANSLILLTMGRADAEAKRHSGALTVTGNTEKGERLCATLFGAF